MTFTEYTINIIKEYKHSAHLVGNPVLDSYNILENFQLSPYDASELIIKYFYEISEIIKNYNLMICYDCFIVPDKFMWQLVRDYADYLIRKNPKILK